METLTRGQIKARAVARARLKNNESRGGQPDSPWMVDEMMEEVADALTVVINGSYATYTTDLTSGTAHYCAPVLYYIESASVLLSDGETSKPLAVRDSQEAEGASPGWRTESPAATGEPHTLITEGFGGAFTLYPEPDYSETGGITLRGFALYARTLWPDDDDDCPLHPMAHNLLVLGLASKLAADDEQPARAASLWADFLLGKGRYEAAAHTYHEGFRSRRGNGGDAEYIPSGPLNL